VHADYNRGCIIVSRFNAYLLSYRDIRKNGIHVETHVENKEEFLILTKLTGYGKQICEKIPSLDSGLYCTYIKPINHVTYKVIFQNVDAFKIWHDRLGHRGIWMMRKIISNSIGHDLNEANFPNLRIMYALPALLGN
jgi:hypothetical protein